MPSTQLKPLLESLHAELRHAQGLDPETIQQLRVLGNDIERAIGGRRGENLAERVGQAMERFEGEHPKLTDILNRLAASLSSLGI